MNKKTTTITRTKNTKPLTALEVRRFQKKVYDHFAQAGRDFPWRKNINPYRVLVSEIMLQQTQVERVIEKYQEFLVAFPDFPSLAKAPLPRLLAIWSGMGYNRRALSLKSLAQKVVDEHRGRLPSEPDLLLTLPGIGPYTAGAVAAFAFNKPVVFMDTNIRRVHIHEFFHDRARIHDEELVPFVLRTMDAANPRKWYNALMDYGAMLKKEHANPNRKSAHYARQSPFENSNRQARGTILKVLVAESSLSVPQIVKKTGIDEERVSKNILALIEEGFIGKKGKYFVISGTRTR